MTARVLFALYGAALLGALVIDMLVLLPLRGVGNLDRFYAPLDGYRISWIVSLVTTWVVMSVAVIVVLAVRLGSRATWRWNYPYSWWRVARSVMLVSGVICFGSVMPGYVVGSSPVVKDSGELTSRTWDLWGEVALVGGLALLTALLMYCVGVGVHVFRDLTGRNEQPTTGRNQES